MLQFPIDTIIFDLDGTLRYSKPSADDTQFQIASRLGLIDDPERQKLGSRWQHYYWAQSQELSEDMNKFESLDDGFWINYAIRYLKSLNISTNTAVKMAPRMVEDMEKEYDPQNSVYPCVPETLNSLKSHGYNLGLVSNRSNPCQAECEELGLLKFFDFAYVAAEVNAWKPDPRIFDRAMALTGSLPEQIIYIGDNYYADILGARNAGIQPVLLDGKGIFPEADCLVIGNLRELVDILL
jgi:putative hydrolase of the HAD superfamily